MRLNQLGVAGRQRRKRVGRGISSGRGKTSTGGTKGQKSRAGARIRAGFEGGQTPIYQRLPKLRGISRKQKTPTKVVNVEDLERVFPAGATIDMKALKNSGLIKPNEYPVKILSDGEVTKAFKISLPISKTAKEKIEKAGGSITEKQEPKKK
jgi:large subunit ribosomal protein L15